KLLSRECAKDVVYPLWRLSRWERLRSYLVGKTVYVVTLEAVSFPLRRKSGGGGHVGSCNVPTKEEKWQRWSHWKLPRARLGGNVSEVVTMKAPSCPLGEKSVRGGHDEGSIVPA